MIMVQTLYLVLAALHMQGASTSLLRLDQARPSTGLPVGWTVRAVRGQRAPDVAVKDSSGERFVRFSGAGRAAWFVHELETRLASAGGRLSWTWRVPVAPAGADMRANGTDDSALRVFVVFAPAGRFERPPRTLFYSVGQVEPLTFERVSSASKNLHVFRVAPTAASPVWSETTVDPAADYVRIWGVAAPRIVAVGFMQDSDQTKSPAVADVAQLTWRSKDASTP